MINDQAIIEKLKEPRTRESAYKQLVHLYSERLYWHIRKIVIEHHDADDVLQNVFIGAYRNIDSFEGNSTLLTWFYKIATNESINFVKSKAKRNSLMNVELTHRVSGHLTADNYFNGNEIERILQEAIQLLPQKQKLVFNMRYFDNLSYKDMAEILETSEGALKASYHIAVKKIETFVNEL